MSRSRGLAGAGATLVHKTWIRRTLAILLDLQQLELPPGLAEDIQKQLGYWGLNDSAWTKRDRKLFLERMGNLLEARRRAQNAQGQAPEQAD